MIRTFLFKKIPFKRLMYIPVGNIENMLLLRCMVWDPRWLWDLGQLKMFVAHVWHNFAGAFRLHAWRNDMTRIPHQVDLSSRLQPTSSKMADTKSADANWDDYIPGVVPV